MSARVADPGLVVSPFDRTAGFTPSALVRLAQRVALHVRGACIHACFLDAEGTARTCVEVAVFADFGEVFGGCKTAEVRDTRGELACFAWRTIWCVGVALWVGRQEFSTIKVRGIDLGCATFQESAQVVHRVDAHATAGAIGVTLRSPPATVCARDVLGKRIAAHQNSANAPIWIDDGAT